MRWQVKCVVDSCKALVPFHDRIREIKGRVQPCVPDATYDVNTIRQGLMQIEWLGSVRPVAGATVMEIGTGWQPIIPILFSLAGAGKIYLTDLNRLCRSDTFAAALASVRAQKRLILDALSISERDFDNAVRADAPVSLDERFSELRLSYLAPCDCQNMNLPASSVDMAISRAVFEHIPPEVIHGILMESFRLLKPNGLICHIIDNSDHWEHRDKRISRVNFLKFSDATFRWTHINSLNYQNRLRHSEYLAIVRQTGFEVVREQRDVDQKALAALSSIPLAQRFRRFTSDDLAALTTYVLATRPASGGTAARAEHERSGMGNSALAN